MRRLPDRRDVVLGQLQGQSLPSISVDSCILPRCFLLIFVLSRVLPFPNIFGARHILQGLLGPDDLGGEPRRPLIGSGDGSYQICRGTDQLAVASPRHLGDSWAGRMTPSLRGPRDCRVLPPPVPLVRETGCCACSDEVHAQR